MADLVTVRYVGPSVPGHPNGEVQAVDPDKWDVPGQTKPGGNFEVVGPGTASSTPMHSVPPAPLVQSPADVVASHNRGDAMLANVLPMAAGLATASVVPESAPALWLLRTLAAGGGGAMLDPLSKAMVGQKSTLGTALQTGAEVGGGQLTGEVAGGLLGKLGESIATDAAGATKAVRKAQPGIDRLVMRERIPVGAPGTTTGQAEIAAREARAGDVMRNLVDQHDATARPFDTNAVLSQVDDEIAKLRQSALPEDAADAERLQIRRDAFARRNPNGLTARTLNDAVKRSQDRAQPTYVKDSNGKQVTIQSTPDEQIFHRLLAREGRNQLRSDIPGFGAQKDRAAELIALDKTYNNAESTPPPPLRLLGNPTQLIPALAKRTFLRPDIASKAGFALTGDATQAGLRMAPNTLMGLINMFGSTTAPPDTLNPTGGSR